MKLLNPKLENFEHLDEKSRIIMKKTVAFFEEKGKAKLKEDDRERIWYQDFLDFVKKENIFATLLTPQAYSDGQEQGRWDSYRNCQFNEILAFYGLCYWYTWQVTILGLGPIWMGRNERVKKKTAQLLKQGNIFAFGLSEKEHGADIYASSMKLLPQGPSQYVAKGSKYYIGNGNKAALVSTFGKMADPANAKDSLGKTKDQEYVFFVVDSQHEKYQCVKNVCNSQNYVSEYQLNDYPITDDDILTKGSEAWDSSLNTVNIGKYNLGWASIGIATHALYESLNHASKRRLFDHSVTEFTHVQQLFVDAYTRLMAMKLFAQRGCDYIRSASAEDRRYLLYTPMVKMKVTTQGEEVVNLLWDVIAAKGFEKDMYFEMAVRDIRALPKLEGTVHVNMALIIKFMKNYFFSPGQFPEIPQMNQAKNDDFLFNQGATKGLGKIKFHDYRKVYDSIDLPNIKIFKKQVRSLKLLLMIGKPDEQQTKDFDFLLNLGELFTLVVYGQLIIENAKIQKVEDALIDQIFEILIRDFSKYSLMLYSKSNTNLKQRWLLKNMIKSAVYNPQRYQHLLSNHVYKLIDQYEMNPGI